MLEEAINALKNVEASHKSEVLTEHRQAMSSKDLISHKVYSPAMLLRAFEYFSCSRAAYELFRKDHQLPSCHSNPSYYHVLISKHCVLVLTCLQISRIVFRVCKLSQLTCFMLLAMIQL